MTRGGELKNERIKKKKRQEEEEKTREEEGKDKMGEKEQDENK